jgi:hypothetical protein
VSVGIVVYTGKNSTITPVPYGLVAVE